MVSLRLITKEVTKFFPIWSACNNWNKQISPMILLIFWDSPKGIYPVDMDFNYHDTSFCDSPALFHYKVNVPALGKMSHILGLILFTYLGRILSNDIKSVGFLVIPLFLAEAMPASCHTQEVLTDASFCWVFFGYWPSAKYSSWSL